MLEVIGREYGTVGVWGKGAGGIYKESGENGEGR
jgi:hypothetical protein